MCLDSEDESGSLNEVFLPIVYSISDWSNSTKLQDLPAEMPEIPYKIGPTQFFNLLYAT